MFDQPIYLAIAAIVLLTAALAFVAYRFRREAKRRREDVKWIKELTTNALDDIQSDDEDRILSGLQTLTYVKDPSARLKALPRLAELGQSPNPIIERQAKVTMEKLSNFAGR